MLKLLVNNLRFIVIVLFCFIKSAMNRRSRCLLHLFFDLRRVHDIKKNILDFIHYRQKGKPIIPRESNRFTSGISYPFESCLLCTKFRASLPLLHPTHNYANWKPSSYLWVCRLEFRKLDLNSCLFHF